MQGSNAESPELLKQLTALIGQDMIREYQIVQRAGQVQVRPLTGLFFLQVIKPTWCMFTDSSQAALLHDLSLVQPVMICSSMQFFSGFCHDLTYLSARSICLP